MNSPKAIPIMSYDCKEYVILILSYFVSVSWRAAKQI